MRAATGLAAAVALCSGLVGGCDPGDGLRFRASFGHLPRSQETACPSAEVPKPDYLSEIDLFRVKLAGPDIDTPIQRDFTAADAEAEGKLQIEQVPAGADRSVLVSGYVSEVSLWRGLHEGITVDPGQSQDVSVLMTRVASMTCTRGPMGTPRLFASATQLQDGRVLVAGGFFEVAVDGGCTGCRSYQATPTAEIYNPWNGTFEPVGDLNRARGLHKAALLGDGRVLIVGGASQALFDPLGSPFPLTPSQHAVNIEIFDPAKGTFSAGPDDPGLSRVFHTVTTLNDGRVLIAGGGTAVTASDAKKESALCEATGDSVTCSQGPPLVYHRIGHTATRLDDGRIFFWGGSADPGDGANACDVAAVTQCPEWFVPDQNVFVAVDGNNPISGASPQSNLFFASAARLGSFGVVIAGGLLRTSASGELSFAEPTQAAFLYAPASNVIGNSLSQTAGAFQLRAPRMLLDATPLALDGRALFAGGYGDLGFTPSRDFEIFDIGGGGFLEDIRVNEQPVLLRQPRGGVSLVHTGGGAVVAIGGEDSASGGALRQVLDTAEIFTDKEEPQL